MRVNFEEKTYENYFNTELSMLSEIYFPLGQVQEGYLGFDSSAFSKNKELWKVMGYPTMPSLPLRGTTLREIADEMETYLGTQLNNIPLMKVNVLFQYKKPEYITRTTGAEWHNWNKPYYRYDIYEEQQKLLMHIHSMFQNKVLVIYASPALFDINSLVDASINKKIIEFSNFKKASQLYRHHRNTYIKAGTYSVACSQPEQIKDFDLIDLINKSSQVEGINKWRSNREFVLNFTNEILTIANNNSPFSKSFKKLNDTISEFKNHRLLYSFLIMRNFRLLTGTQWVIKLSSNDFCKNEKAEEPNLNNELQKDKKGSQYL